MDLVLLWFRCVVRCYGPGSVAVQVCCVMSWTWFCCGPGVLCGLMDLVLFRSRCVVRCYGPGSVAVQVCCMMLWTWFCCGPDVLCDVMDPVLLRSRCGEDSPSPAAAVPDAGPAQPLPAPGVPVLRGPGSRGPLPALLPLHEVSRHGKAQRLFHRAQLLS